LQPDIVTEAGKKNGPTPFASVSTKRKGRRTPWVDRLVDGGNKEKVPKRWLKFGGSAREVKKKKKKRGRDESPAGAAGVFSRKGGETVSSIADRYKKKEGGTEEAGQTWTKERKRKLTEAPKISIIGLKAGSR